MSTALSFAILYMKPVILLTQNTYSVFFKDYIEAMAIALKKKPIDLSHEFPQDISRELVVDQLVYEKYKEDYIKKKGTPEKNTWDVVADYCLGLAEK